MAGRDRAALHRPRAQEPDLQAARAGLRREVKARYWTILDEATSASDAKAGLLALAGDYRRAYPSAMRTIDAHVDQLVAHLRFPLRHRKVIRTTNLLERLFLEERRRTKIIPHAFGERPVLKLMYAAVIRAADRWRGITVGEFEQRQLKVIREELDRAHVERVRPVVRPSASASPVRLSSKNRT